MKCVQKGVDELHKISCNSYYTLIAQQQPEGEVFRVGVAAPSFFNLKYLFVTYRMPLRHRLTENSYSELHLPSFTHTCNMRVHILHTCQMRST